MASTVFDFLMTVPLENGVLRAVIMVAEILSAGFLLFFLWELVLHLPGKIGAARRRRETAMAGMARSTPGEKPTEDIIVGDLAAKSAQPVGQPREA